jgi:purine-nucleoside phosphorylase
LDKLKQTAQYLKKKLPFTPEVAVVLGSGLGDYVEELENAGHIEYTDIPNFIKTTVVGHEGRLYYGTIRGKNVAVLQGRIHLYEGHDINEVVLPARVMSLLGVSNYIVTNASGGINADFKPGDLVAIDDHINFMGKNPLIGKNLDELGPRFPDMSELYDKQLRNQIKQACDNLKISYKSGVYCSVLGPSYETPAEVRMLRTLGGDMVGMSTVPETIAAHHAGMKVAGISCITNLAAGISLDKLSHDEVKEVANQAKSSFKQLLSEFIALV